jgi:hypothetical protein
MDKEITIEETLTASAIVSALTVTPFLIYSEVFELPRRPLVFLSLPLEDFSLIGSVGTTIRGLFTSHLAASTIAEANLVNPSLGMAAATKTVSMWTVSVTDPIYSATNLSDILLEDFPNVEWVRLHLRNMGLAIMEYLDASVADVLEAGSGAITYTASAHFDYAEAVKALAKMENYNWIADEANPPFLIVSPNTAAGLLQDTRFLDSKRYTLYDLGRMVEGEIGMYAGMRVLKSPLLSGVDTGSGTPVDANLGADIHAFIVFPNDTGRGPVVLMAWKRRLETRNFYWTQWAYTYYVSSVRAKPVLVQSTGVCKITITTSP